MALSVSVSSMSSVTGVGKSAVWDTSASSVSLGKGKLREASARGANEACSQLRRSHDSNTFESTEIRSYTPLSCLVASSFFLPLRLNHRSRSDLESGFSPKLVLHLFWQSGLAKIPSLTASQPSNLSPRPRGSSLLTVSPTKRGSSPASCFPPPIGAAEHEFLLPFSFSGSSVPPRASASWLFSTRISSSSACTFLSEAAAAA
mmetsp:Transcript_293/g.643  ORF Transcript_293/g.643 Transcript_293/m.643 type:complete len:203 (+) Transcript_293:1808-2416(+)